jgi:hypothetical protein
MPLLRLLAVPIALALLLASAGAASAAPRKGTGSEQRAIRAALSGECGTTARLVQIAVSGKDPRFAIFAFDDRRRATTLCTAIVRRSSRTARSWRAVEVREGLATTNRAIRPCPRSLPKDLHGTVQPRGARDPQVFCGN